MLSLELEETAKKTQSFPATTIDRIEQLKTVKSDDTYATEYSSLKNINLINEFVKGFEENNEESSVNDEKIETASDEPTHPNNKEGRKIEPTDQNILIDVKIHKEVAVSDAVNNKASACIKPETLGTQTEELSVNIEQELVISSNTDHVEFDTMDLVVPNSFDKEDKRIEVNVETQTQKKYAFQDNECPICQHHVKFSSISILRQHLCKHFRNELKEICGDSIIEGKTCGICRSQISSYSALLTHLGTVHKKLNEILAEKGYSTILVAERCSTEKEKAVSTEVDKHIDSTHITSEPATERNQNDEEMLLIEENLNPIQNSKETEPIEDCYKKNPFLNNKCPMCPNRSYPSISHLRQHLCSHFRSELKYFSKDLMLENNTCGVCSNVIKNPTSLLIHIGTIHKKLDEILAYKGYPVMSVRQSKTQETSINFDACTIVNEELNKMAEEDEENQIFDQTKNGKIDDRENGSLIRENDIECLPTAKEQIQKESKAPTILDEFIKCTHCDERSESLSVLRVHLCINHFMADLESKFSHLTNLESNTCKVCGKLMKKKKALLAHLGVNHRKLEEIMEVQGLPPLQDDRNTGMEDNSSTEGSSESILRKNGNTNPLKRKLESNETSNSAWKVREWLGRKL